MRTILLIVAAAALLSGCQTAQEDGAARGALLGAGTGALIGGLAGGTPGSALLGGVVGGATGGAIGAASARPEPCFVRTRSGHLREVPCDY